MKKKISVKELVWYIIAAAIAITGITFVVIGIIGDHYQGLASDNWVKNSSEWLGSLGYRGTGLLLFGIAVLVFIIVLNVFAARGEKDDERAIRRAQRLKIESEVKNEKVIEADTADIK